jgi:hypothetical protein
MGSKIILQKGRGNKDFLRETKLREFTASRNLTKEDIQMANKHMKRCPTFVIRELQIKTIMQHHYNPIRMAKI